MDEVARGDKMKEFEKWYKNNVCNSIEIKRRGRTPLPRPECQNIPIYMECRCECCENLRKEGWKASLECVLDKCHHYQNQDVIDFIQEELEQ